MPLQLPKRLSYSWTFRAIEQMSNHVMEGNYTEHVGLLALQPFLADMLELQLLLHCQMAHSMFCK